MVEPFGGQNVSFLLGKQAERGVDFDIGFVPNKPYGPQNVGPLVGSLFLANALFGNDDPEPLGTVAFGAFGRLQN